jgi:uridine kinase
VDGVDGAGKTTFPDAFADVVRERGRPVARPSVDDFHAREPRYRLARDSPVGFRLYSYAFDHDVLAGLRPGGNRRFRRASHDLETDELLELTWETAPTGALVITDGIFLHRDELAGVWAYSVFLDVPFELTAGRDGGPTDPNGPHLAPYVEGQRLYFAACRPWERATLVIDNSVPDMPLVRSGDRS